MTELLELKIRGYVTPEDVSGDTDAERLQNALILAAEEDIRKVLIGKSLKLEKTVRIPAEMEIRLAEGVRVEADGAAFVNENAADPSKASWAFEDKWIYLLGEKDACIQGDLKFYHAGNLVIEDLNVKGSISFEFCREVRMERNRVETGKNTAVTLMRGCNNYIVQENFLSAAGTALFVDASLREGEYVVGKDTDIHELIIRDNRMEGETALFIGAGSESGVFNVLHDCTTTGGTALVVGHENETLDKKRYFNLTSTDHTCRVEKILRNEVKHCFFGEA